MCEFDLEPYGLRFSHARSFSTCSTAQNRGIFQSYRMIDSYLASPTRSVVSPTMDPAVMGAYVG